MPSLLECLGKGRKDMVNSPLIILVGPTAVGKTQASIHLAREIGGEIISGDSMQVFRGLDIGTAKITKEEMAGIPHHLIDIKNPEESFSVAEFKVLVDEQIAQIAQRGKVPILVGGTGLYINGVIYEYHFGEAASDEAYRRELLALAQQKGNAPLHAQLEKVDPKSALRIHLNDTKRIVRALEIYHVTGSPMSDREGGPNRNSPRYPIVYLALDMPREQLYTRINQRVDQMLAKGWLDEVRHLLDSGVPQEAFAFQGLGYRQLVAHLGGGLSLGEAVELIKRDTRHFAKRQLTWFRHDPNIFWVCKDGQSDQTINQVLQDHVRQNLASF